MTAVFILATPDDFLLKQGTCTLAPWSPLTQGDKPEPLFSALCRLSLFKKKFKSLTLSLPIIVVH